LQCNNKINEINYLRKKIVAFILKKGIINFKIKERGKLIFHKLALQKTIIRIKTQGL
jgi:hypothetical protein